MNQEQILEVPEAKAKNLRAWNLAMGFLHLFQGILMLVLSNSFSLPVVGTFLKFNSQTMQLVPTPETLFSLRIGPMVAIFLFLSALAHFLVSTFFYKWYLDNLAHHINKARWIEYAFSSSIMIVIIAQLVGVYELSSLILIFGLNAAMILFGWLMELHNQTTDKTNQLLQYKKVGRWSDYLYGEKAYIILSLVAKSLLAWQVFAGTLRPV